MAVGRHVGDDAELILGVTPATFLPGVVNVAFCDGHVEYFKLNNLWTIIGAPFPCRSQCLTHVLQDLKHIS